MPASTRARLTILFFYRMTLVKRLTICPELRAFNSYGVLTAHLVKAWVASGVYPSIRPLALQDALGASVPRYVKEKIVHSDQPENWELYIAPAVHVPNQRKRVAFYSMYESTLWPPRSIRLLNKAEIVIVPCEWCRVGLHDSGLTRPVEVVPLGTDETIFTPTPVSAEGPCVFGAAGRLANGSKRKAVNAVLEAFLKEFPDEPDVRLKIKAFSDCPPAATIDPRVNVTEKFLTDAQMADWYRSLTCFVSASRSEGWGLNPLEAMFCGRACIAPIYSGHREFLTEDNCYSLDFKEVPAEEIWTGHGNWCEPDPRHLQKLMRSVYKNRQDAIERGARAHESVRHLTWKATAVRLAALVVDDLGR